MPIRNAHKVGDYLMVDDHSGFVHYRSEMIQLWDGSWVHKSQYEERNPQEFVRALNDPRPLKDVRPEELTPEPCNFAPLFVGNTKVYTKNGPGVHLFNANVGIGKMEIGCTFVVRDEPPHIEYTTDQPGAFSFAFDNDDFPVFGIPVVTFDPGVPYSPSGSGDEPPPDADTGTVITAFTSAFSEAFL